MIEDKATEKWKERAKKMGLIVNMGVDKPMPRTKGDEQVGKTRGKTKDRVKKKK